jgi:hypothetical protein
LKKPGKNGRANRRIRRATEARRIVHEAYFFFDFAVFFAGFAGAAFFLGATAACFFTAFFAAFGVALSDALGDDTDFFLPPKTVSQLEAYFSLVPTRVIVTNSPTYINQKTKPSHR